MIQIKVNVIHARKNIQDIFSYLELETNNLKYTNVQNVNNTVCSVLQILKHHHIIEKYVYNVTKNLVIWILVFADKQDRIVCNGIWKEENVLNVNIHSD